MYVALFELYNSNKALDKFSNWLIFFEHQEIIDKIAVRGMGLNRLFRYGYLRTLSIETLSLHLPLLLGPVRF